MKNFKSQCRESKSSIEERNLLNLNYSRKTCSIKSKNCVNIIQVFRAACEIRDKGRSRVRQWRDLEFYDRVTRGSWPPAGPEALRGKSIYRRPNKNTNDDDGARSASFGFRKRLEIVREKETQSGRGKIRRMKVGRVGRQRKRESGGSSELDRAQRMRKEERNCRSNVANVQGVCLERRRLHQPSDRATRSFHFYYYLRTVSIPGARRF